MNESHRDPALDRGSTTGFDRYGGFLAVDGLADQRRRQKLKATVPKIAKAIRKATNINTAPNHSILDDSAIMRPQWAC